MLPVKRQPFRFKLLTVYRANTSPEHHGQQKIMLAYTINANYE
ncbi:unnamed protein product [Acanthoscelides obtectus]|uniref:Uncharacterized protein n=1 Tax=Acanthoscelides obtectus TaxID=200917 RepID=A0A9P0LU76_ACAOB|nr:unnamed protein product [Acanthoscelides obtectus]CAH2013112.1 unnamed protein product [Acanthoscelides obtectus]CAK1660959.1 hypothetical protein AOBTE_LOCUS22366 [Acanthoscelides obtectus]CAK1661024.1 hypothetical protein AOBTE_LOCUS22389 [Acanthoscelides obtectus]